LQLPTRDEAELAPRDPRDRGLAQIVSATAGAQNVTQFRRRDEVGHIVVLSDGFWPTSTGGVDFGQFCAAGLRDHVRQA
jgi:hypothetical protein